MKKLAAIRGLNGCSPVLASIAGLAPESSSEEFICKKTELVSALIKSKMSCN